jgi:nucleotide-binding universal stress UspA family protein
MTIVKNILVPVDLSEHSLPALDVAIDLSLVHHAGITLLYVHETAAFELPEGLVENMPSELDRIYDQVGRGLSRLERKARSAGVARVEKRILQGPVVNAIVRFSEGFDFVVLCTHGRTGLERFVMGSVAQKVLELASCPVIVVRAGKKRPPV